MLRQSFFVLAFGVVSLAGCASTPQGSQQAAVAQSCEPEEETGSHIVSRDHCTDHSGVDRVSANGAQTMLRQMNQSGNRNQ